MGDHDCCAGITCLGWLLLGYYMGDHDCCAGIPCFGTVFRLDIILRYSERYGLGTSSMPLCAIIQSTNQCRFRRFVVSRRRARQIYFSWVDRFGTVRYGSVRFGSIPFGSVRFRSVRYGSVRFGSVRFGSV